MLKNAEYHYNPEIDVKGIYEKILTGAGTSEDFELISENFAAPSRPLITFKGSYKLKRNSEHILYDDTQYTYTFSLPGYVHFHEAEIFFLPFLHINELQTRCDAVVPSRQHTKELLSGSLIKNFCFQMGIALPILDENINNCMRLYNEGGGKTVLCEGKDPVNGRPPVIELVYEMTQQVGKEDESGNIDYKEKNFVNNVVKGLHVANYIPAVEAYPGRDLFNQTIKPVDEKPFTYKIGEGLELVKRDNRIIAAIDGVLSISTDQTIRITEDQVIAGDVDLASGNIEANGNVVIKKNITPGFTVTARGNITVEGNIEEATVKCGKNLTVKGGISGNPETHVEAGGDIKALFLRNATVKAGGNIDIGQFIMNSMVTSNGVIRAVTEKKGKVVGGSLSGKLGIEVYEAGNLSGVKTALTVGIDIEKEKALHELNEKVKHSNETILKLKGALGNQYFQDPAGFFKRLPPAKIPIIKKVIEELKKAIEQRKMIEAELSSHSTDGTRNKMATITFLKEAHEGVTLQITNITLTPKGVPTPTTFVFSQEDSAIIPTSVKKDT